MDELLILIRAIHLASSAMLAGAVMFVHFVAVPAFKAIDRHVVGPPMTWLLYGSLVVSFASGAAWFFVVAVRIAGHPLSDAFSDDTAWLVLTQTQFGLVWCLRSLCVALLVGLLLLVDRPNRHPSNRSAVLTVTLSALYLGGLAWAGHGGASPGWEGYVHLGADVLHLVAAGAWLGALPALALSLNELNRAHDGNSQEVIYRITERFSDFGVVVVATLLASGLINTWFLIGSMQTLFGTVYGRLLLVKIALFVAMVAIAATNRLRYLPRLATVGGDGLHPEAAALRRLQRNTIAEIGLGLGVIIIVGALGVFEPAAHPASHMH